MMVFIFLFILVVEKSCLNISKIYVNIVRLRWIKEMY